MPESLQPKLVTNDDPKAPVRCRVCGDEKEAGQMSGHLGKKHKGINLAVYVETYGADAGKDFYIHRRGPAKPVDPEAPPKPPSNLSMEDEVLSRLSTSERKFYDEYAQEIFGQVDRDVAQWPVVMSLTLDMIELTRLRAKASAGDNIKDPKISAAIATATKYTEERIRGQMKDLGISRAAKQQNKAQIRSTPFSLISGYMDELERSTPAQLHTLEHEERKLDSVVLERKKKLYYSVAPEITESQDGAVPSLEIDDIIADAGIEI